MSFFSRPAGSNASPRPISAHRFRELKNSINVASTGFLSEGLSHLFEPVLQQLSRSQIQLLLGSLMLLFAPLIMIRPDLWQQSAVALLLVGVGRWLLHLEGRQSTLASEHLHLLLVALSILTTLRYLYYRGSCTLNFSTPLDSLFSLLLFSAELYGVATLFLAYFQTLKTRSRQVIDLSQISVEQWPTVDIYIPTYSEDVEIVRKTVLAAVALDYPHVKKQVYILDDGRAEKYYHRRLALQQLCEDLGCKLLTRDNNDHAKAGNINEALRRTDGELVLILDCDHMPIRSFLQETVGFFGDQQVALVQTPHWFYNPDPFERNLRTKGHVPVGNELFYKVLQKGNDYWNAAFFCGSAAVIRRGYLLEIGGIATETVTEDCHTSLRLHALGYKSVYYDKIMVAGLAPETFASYVGQQVRWARGMAQILRLENPMFNRKLRLSMGQRICYFSATSHFFFGFPRLMYAIAPTCFLLFGINSVKGLGIETLAYALPHIVLSMQTNHIPYKHVRFSFWNEIYEFAMSFQAGIVTILALINPKLGSFNVTRKGEVVNQRQFDLDSIRYLVFLGAITAASMLTVPFWLVISPLEIQAVLINALWCCFNLLLVLAACLVALEQPQIRRSHRLPRHLTAIIHSNGQSWVGSTTNISETGAQILLDQWPNVSDEVRLELVGDCGARVLLDARIIRGTATQQLQTLLSLDFMQLSRTQMDDLILVIYSDVAEWYAQHRSETDRPLVSLRFIATSLRRAFRELHPETGLKVRKQVQATAHLFWEGWAGVSYMARVTEMSHREIQIELTGENLESLEPLQYEQPLIALLLSRSREDASPQSLLAAVQRVEILPTLSRVQLAAHPETTAQHIVMELAFPPSLDQQQRQKIKQILRSLA
jgi:cellulose synthase (UDP-forming)